MCGIAGLIDRRAGITADRLRDIGLAMTESIRHRGPDAGDVWVDAVSGVMLGQRRLAIIDLSPGGAQPMHSADGRFVIVFNGEIYNFREIAVDLAAAGVTLRSQSDTEVLLEACALWGIEAALSRVIGMFAFALWDRATGAVQLARDRLGVKPLYYAFDGARLIFGSQLKALRAVPGWQPTINRDAVAAYLRFAYVPGDRTIYGEAAKLLPGCVLTLPRAGDPVITRYWDMRQVAVEGFQRQRACQWSDAEAEERLAAVLTDAVCLRMIADVPLGAFLSRGIDSSTVVALMQSLRTAPVKTFSIGFQEAGYDEAPHARAVATHLGTDHTEFYVEPSHALDTIPTLTEWFDEPFADASQIPTYLVSALTRRHVTVALSGDGGDESFAGYNRYVWGDRFARRLGGVPRGLRRLGAAGLRAVPPALWDRLLTPVPQRLKPSLPGDTLHKLATILDLDGPDAIYRRLVSQIPNPEEFILGGREHFEPPWDGSVSADIPDFVERMQYIDTVTYLPDDILTKVDRATMAVGLEGREPLLDHRVVEFAWSLPRRFRIRDGQRKWLLRRVLDRHVPRALIDRPKMGFGVPIDAWLRGPLRGWAEDLLDPRALAADGLLRPEPITRMWGEHLSGQRNFQYPLWTVLMLQAWLRRWS